jgi:hypothetical protein
MQACSGRGKKNCDGDCQWHAVEMKCNVAHPAYHRVMCSPAWQNLMAEVNKCESETPGACRRLGCTGNSRTTECQKWFGAVLGKEEGQVLLDKVSGITQWSCGDGEHSGKCEAVVRGARACAEKGKAGKCHHLGGQDGISCEQNPTECSLSPTSFDSICAMAN